MFIIDELSILLRINTTDNKYYSRVDVCEAESIALTCILRIILKYSLELNNIDLMTLNSLQLLCFQRTIQVADSCLLPNIVIILNKFCFSEINIQSTLSHSYQVSSMIHI